jgi:hypothetical protein
MHDPLFLSHRVMQFAQAGGAVAVPRTNAATAINR